MSTVFVTLCDKSYYSKAISTLRSLRDRGQWTGPTVLITVDFYPDDFVLKDANVLLYPTTHIDTSYLVEQIKANPLNVCKNVPENTPSVFLEPSGTDDNRHLGKLYQWDKLQVFSDFFKQWERVVFMDAGMQVFNSVNYILDVPWKGKFVAPDDSSDDFTKRFGRQIRIYSNEKAKNDLFQDFGFTEEILYQRYFMNCIFIYDTDLLKQINVQTLIDGMNKYPICGNNEMTLLNLYFTFKYKVWSPLPEFTSCGKKRIYGWCEMDYPNFPNCSQFCVIKYPVTQYIAPTYPQYKSTVVSMFFDLHKLKDASKETRSRDFYLHHGKYTLSLPFPLVLFCDSKTRPILQSIRDTSVDTEKVPTIYIEKDLTEYDFYKMHIPMITEHRKHVELYVNHRNTPSYFLLTMFKLHALEIARQHNFFNTTHTTWFDFGCHHIAPDDFEESAYQMLCNPKPKIAACYIHYRTKNEMQHMKQYVPGGPCGIAATVITCENSYIERFYNSTLSIFHEMLTQEVGHSEETCMAYCYMRHPELFTLYYGDYYSILKNYHSIKRDYPTIKHFFLNKVLQDGRMDLAKAVSEKIMESISNGYITIPDEDKDVIQYLYAMA